MVLSGRNINGKENNSQTAGLEYEKEKLLKLSEVSLILDTYDDIFSDFDPRTYEERGLSDDFLSEAKKRVRKKSSGTIELKFLIPANKRNMSDETIIKKRLTEHFNKEFEHLNKQRRKIIKEGAIFITFGIVVMFIATHLILFGAEKDLLTSFIIIVMEPAGWFLFWEGASMAIFESKKVTPELEFCEKMSNCEISFLAY
ncbi:MAG: hypothetical protein CVT89_07530 [Candidatus Altiarchaeales archaeon HGW-Altiarchaeales-2]|nr:MAG: hypothetical protein CVT89_07530 [Candidatus Altiarchaeales archaeon HGW-Altiarchaeales-2]